MFVRKRSHGFLGSLRHMLAHGAITLLAVSIAFSLPQMAKFILYDWWPRVENDPNLILATEIALASVLVLLFNLVGVALEGRRQVASAKLAALEYARDGRGGRISRLRERALVRRLPAVRDAFILTLTGYDTFVGPGSLLRPALEQAYEIRVMLVDPTSRDLHRHIESLPRDITPETFLREIEASVAYLSELRTRGKKISLKFYEQSPFWKVIVLGEHVWVQHCHSGFEVKQQPEYVFALQPDNPRMGLFVPFYMHFLDQWNEPRHPEYDFDTRMLIYRDRSGNETGRVPLGESIAGVHRRRRSDPTAAVGCALRAPDNPATVRQTA